MTLKSIIETIDFEDIWNVYCEAFGCKRNEKYEEIKAAHLRFFEHLKTIEPVETGFVIFLESIHLDESLPPYWHPFATKDNVDYDMYGTPWKNWLGMDINENTLSKFKPHEIAAYCLREVLGSWDEDENKMLDEIWKRESV